MLLPHRQCHQAATAVAARLPQRRRSQAAAAINTATLTLCFYCCHCRHCRRHHRADTNVAMLLPPPQLHCRSCCCADAAVAMLPQPLLSCCCHSQAAADTQAAAAATATTIATLTPLPPLRFRQAAAKLPPSCRRHRHCLLYCYCRRPEEDFFMSVMYP